ncbi:MAG TPA: indole-3-glycerol phosphate synthase TrpC, partial [Bacteroidota bacterium]|nr:indole-3-glycerol phosphate synthase TrpC [Bacteroidota bacterium]
PTISLQKSVASHPIFGIIAEIKRSSPSAGILRKLNSPNDIAQMFEEHGAAGISVLTDEKYFAGTLDDLQSVRSDTQLPVLRKDFIIDDYQIVEAKAFGADAILLIAAILDRNQLAELYFAAREIGLECLVELYETKEIDILDLEQMKFIGVNNRDLRTFQVDLNHTLDVARHLPKDAAIVSESGITKARDLQSLSAGGIHAALIGEYFMKNDNPGKALGSMLKEFTDEIKS